MTPFLRRLALLLLLVEVAGICWLVLNPSSATPTGAVLRVSEFLVSRGAPTWMASTTGWEYLLNVALFVPLGLLAALVWDRVALEGWVIVGFVLSAGLELAQLVVIGTRSATVSDVSANTIGMFAGALVAVPTLWLLDRRTRRERHSDSPTMVGGSSGYQRAQE